jgi:hypothetical protein
MRSKLPPMPKKGDTRHVKKFAWTHKRTAGNIEVWLEFYDEVQEWRKHGFFGYFDWFRNHDEHICRPEGPKIRGGYSPYHPCLCGQEALGGGKMNKWPRA